MVLSLSASFRDAATQGGQTPVLVVDFDLDANPIGTYRIHNFGGMLSGLSESNNAILSSVANLSHTVDPITREVRQGEMSLEIVDEGTIRAWANAHKFFDKRIYIKLGFDGVAIGDYLTIFVGRVVEMLPGFGKIVLKLKDDTSLTGRHKFGGQYINKHPLEVAKQLIEYGASTTSVTAADFDPANYTSTISHYAMTDVKTRTEKEYFQSRADHHEQAGEGGLTPVGGMLYGRNADVGGLAPSLEDPLVQVLPLVNEIAMFLGATIYVDESGSVRCKVYDSGASSVRTLTADDYDEMNQVNAYGGMVNRVVVEIGQSEQGAVFIREDATSKAAFGEHELKVKCSNLASVAYETKKFSITSVSPVTYDVFADGGSISGFAGTRGTVAKVTSPTDGFLHTAATGATLSASRPGYFLIVPLETANHFYFGKATSLTINYESPGVMAHTAYYQQRDDDGDYVSGTSVKTLNSVNFSMEELHGNQFESEDIEDPDRANALEIIDVTIVRNWADSILTRFANGSIEVEFRTSLRHIDLELGDLIEIDTDNLLLDGADFNDSSVSITAKFEIVGKELDITSDVPSIKFVACQSSISTTPSLSIDDVVDRPTVTATPIGLRPGLSPIGVGSVMQGMDVSVASGLDLNISPGVLIRGDGRIMSRAAYEGVGVPDDIEVDLGIDASNGACVVAQRTATSTSRVKTIRLIEASSGAIASNIDRRVLGGAIGPKNLSPTMRDGFNLLRNGGFESWTHGDAFLPDTWTMVAGDWNTDAKRSEIQAEGLYSVALQTTTASVGLASEYIPVREGEVYLVSASMKAAASGNTSEIAVKFFSAGKSTISTVTVQSAAITTSWARIGGAVAAPTNARYATVIVERTAGTKIQYIDDVKMEVGSPMFSAKAGSIQTLNANPITLAYDTELTDVGGWYDNALYKATAPSSGTYEVDITAVIYYSGTGSKDTVQVHLYKNGVSLVDIAHFEIDTHTSVTHPYVSTLSTLVSANAGDAFTVVMTGNTNNSGRLANYGSVFSMKLIR